MMFTYRNLMTVCCAAVLAFGLAACGSDDEMAAVDDDEMMVTEPMQPMEPTPVAVAIPDATYLDEDNMPAAGTVTIAPGMTGTNAGVTFLCAEGGDPCEVTVAEDGSATATGGTVTASLTATAMEQVTAAKEMKAEEDAEMALMMRARAIAQAAALGDGGTGTFVATSLTISNAASKDTSVTTPGYTPAEEQPGMLGTFSGHALMNTSSAARTDHLVVYTDIGEPKPAEFFESDGVDSTRPVYSANTEGVLPLADGPTAPTTANETGYFSGANLDLAIFPSKTPGGSVRKEFAANAKSGDVEANDIYKVSGSFDGADGTYTCDPAGTATVCTVTVASNGVYTFATGDTWTFAPNPGEMAYREDSEFLRFGWWLRDPTKATGQYQFNAFYAGTLYTVVGATDADTTGVGVTGSATYTGNAAGRYVADGMGGSFTADAVLEAKFGDGALDANGNVATISGDITNFQGGEGMSGWSVKLHSIGMTTLDEDSPADPLFMTTAGSDRTSATYNGTTAMIGDVTAYGSWEGRFYGNEKENLPETGSSERINAPPLAVAGKFDAAGSGTSIAGAFGARR